MKNLLTNKGYEVEEISLEKGHILYSKSEINNTFGKDGKSLYENFKDVYESCKDFHIIKDKNEVFTYRYNYYWENDKNTTAHATIVMVNPAFAYSEKMDTTISNINAFFDAYKKLEIKSFDIVNLYPVRMPKLDCLACFNSFLDFKEKEYHNLLKKYLKQRSENGAILVAAWGDDFHTKAKSIFKGMHFKAFGLSKQNAPLHFRRYSFLKKEIEVMIKNGRYKMPGIDV